MSKEMREQINKVKNWKQFLNESSNFFIIKGTKRMTLITDINNVIPRTDLAIQFYNMGGEK